MRFHTLRMTAFGPFPDAETVDFDALGADGLFLLHGRTGAGKTTVLDAITFALYGVVPGQRSTAGLKSSHAPTEREPWVELEFTLDQVRWNVRRRAVFDRPKKRGTGTVRENAKLLLSRREGEELLPVSANIQGAGAELRDLLPLSPAQFTKVILLPQGEFAEFLHANSSEKQEVLQKLFDTRTFEELQLRLTDDARDLRRRSDALATRIAEQTAVLRGAAGDLLDPVEDDGSADEGDGGHGEGRATPEEDLREEDEVGPVLIARLRDQVEELAERLTSRRERTDAAAEAADRRFQELATQHRSLRALAAHRLQVEEHERSRAEVERDRAAVAAHRRADELHGWFLEARRLGDQEEQRRAEAESTLEEADASLGAQQDVEVPEQSSARERLEAALTALHELRGRLGAQRAEELEAERTSLEGRIESFGADLESARKTSAESAAQVERLRTEIRELEAEALDDAPLEEELHALRRRIDGLRRRAEILERRADDVVSRDQAETRCAALTEEARSAAQEHSRLLEGHLRGVAARLSAGLESDTPCPVCGSPEHPDPAPSGDDPITEEDVEAASARHQDARGRLARAQADHDALCARVEEAEEQLNSLPDAPTEDLTEDLTDGSTDDEGSHLDDVARAVRAAESAAEDVEASRAARRRRRELLEGRRTALHTADRRRLTAEHSAETLDRQLEDARGRTVQIVETLHGLRGPHPTVAARMNALEQLRLTLVRAQELHERLRESQAQHQEAERTAERRLAESEFTDAEAVESARLAPDDLDLRVGRRDGFDRRSQQLEDQARTPEITTALQYEHDGVSDPGADSVAAAQEALASARRAAEADRLALHTFDSLRGGFDRAADQLSGTLREQEELAAHQRLRAELAATVSGTGPDNMRSMTLTSYVLAARLERVAEAATRHLRTMSDGRYRLRHDDVETGRGRLGLDLKVLDEHSDDERPTSSLSGGETFMASLAMALGLAEVVQSESGGIGLESLFVDEGFGSLDEETLDHVMGALHRLQGEGRRVGVVSHVTEMHRAIPTQLRIHRGPHGSTTSHVLPLSG